MATTGGYLHIGEATATGGALAVGARLRDSLDDARPVALYMTPLAGEALVCGNHQRAQHALSAGTLDGCTVLRRATGGLTVTAGDGIVYVALALRDASTLMRCPPRAILNRNVRGVLQGLRAARVETNYFGRDTLHFGVLPGAYVGWARDVRGGLLLEFFIGVERSFAVDSARVGYPPPPQPPFRGRIPTALSQLSDAPTDFATLADAIAGSHATQFGIEFEPHAPPLLDDDALDACRLRVRHDELSWSPPQPEAIGFVAAGVALDDDASIAQLQLAGDFMESDATTQLLSQRAGGCGTGDDALVELINGIYTDDAHFIEGIKDIGSLLSVVRTAIAAARS